MFDIQLEIQHLVYIFVSCLSWLGITIWANVIVNEIFTVVPIALSAFITISYWIGGIGIVIGIALIIWTTSE